MAIPHVLPGEVIRANLINQLIDAANAGGTTVPSGVTVPDLFGRTLGQARSILTQPSINLALGTALDAFGAVVDPNAPGSGSRFVIGQSPSAGTQLPAGSPVNLVIAAIGTGGGTGTQPGLIRTETPTGTVTSTFRVNDTLVIIGSGFSVTTAFNTVTFDGVPAASVSSDPASPTQRLIVVVPTGIPGGPVNPGDPDKPGVVLAVSVSGSTPGTLLITVAAPSAVPLPNILNFTPSQQFLNGSVTLNGQNFSNVISRNTVSLGATPATVTSASPGQLIFTVPPDIPGLGLPSGSSISVSITVTVRDGGGNIIGSDVSDTTLTVRRP